jgi:hypothetical protein
VTVEFEQRRLDGNAASGLLGAIFPFDMSMVQTRCATCSRMEPLAAQLTYADAPGLVMRCVHCESVLLSVVHGDGRYWLEMRGAACMQIAESSA